ncbi:MAG: hypothetical protein H0V19_06190 [Euzebyales bacterium]|nr:hypothetical protein [Euzebyales bacterium]MBA3620743.1 hypothetical protein [Euzebyales bacterium]
MPAAGGATPPASPGLDVTVAAWQPEAELQTPIGIKEARAADRQIRLDTTLSAV